MAQDIQKTESYVHYDFVYVKCNVCGEASEKFLYQEHLTADETILYIEESTGFSICQEVVEEINKSINTGENYNKGGMVCKKCSRRRKAVARAKAQGINDSKKQGE